MAERFKFNDEEENIDENDNQQDDLEKEYYDNTDYSYTKSKNKSNIFAQKIKRKHAIICNIFHWKKERWAWRKK